MKKWLLALLLLIILSAPLWAQPTYAVGDTVENFTLRNQSGTNVSLADFPDLIKFLAFWTPG